MNCTPKVRQTLGGAVFMKLSREDKIKIYRLRKQGITKNELIKKYKVNKSVIENIVRLADRHGENILYELDKRKKYTAEYKAELINKVLTENKSLREIAIENKISDQTILRRWVEDYKKNGYTIVEKQKGKPSKMKNKTNKSQKQLSKLEQLERENEYLRAENAILKKLKALRLKEESERKKRQK